jgi:hypothetical protein
MNGYAASFVDDLDNGSQLNEVSSLPSTSLTSTKSSHGSNTNSGGGMDMTLLRSTVMAMLSEIHVTLTPYLSYLST